MGVEIGDGVVSHAERDGMGGKGRKLMRGFHCLLFTLCLFAFCLWQATMIRIRRRLMAVVTARAVVDVAAALSSLRLCLSLLYCCCCFFFFLLVISAQRHLNARRNFNDP